MQAGLVLMHMRIWGSLIPSTLTSCNFSMNLLDAVFTCVGCYLIRVLMSMQGWSNEYPGSSAFSYPFVCDNFWQWIVLARANKRLSFSPAGCNDGYSILSLFIQGIDNNILCIVYMLAFHLTENSSNKPSVYSTWAFLDIAMRKLITCVHTKDQDINTILNIGTSNISFWGKARGFAHFCRSLYSGNISTSRFCCPTN